MNVDLICFSHLRWNFVYQRPQHLLSRFAKNNRVFVMEEPIYGAHENHSEVTKLENQDIWIVVPRFVDGTNHEEGINLQRRFLDELISSYNINNFIAWYYAPMALEFSNHLHPDVIVYDCMDELSAFKFAPPALKQFESELLSKADVVFTGGHNLYQAKKHLHANIFPFPSSIDKEHFYKARSTNEEPDDQVSIPHPRIGFYGVIDERLNIHLVEELAVLKPEWHFIILGPVVKIDPNTLPRRDNIHYIDGKSYSELPVYLSGWDVAMMPFALNESTQFISPTKTPEFLAGGKGVVSTSIIDVVTPYGKEGLVYIADDAETFVQAIEKILSQENYEGWLEKVDSFLEKISWDETWKAMNELIKKSHENKFTKRKNPKIYV